MSFVKALLSGLGWFGLAGGTGHAAAAPGLAVFRARFFRYPGIPGPLLPVFRSSRTTVVRYHGGPVPRWSGTTVVRYLGIPDSRYPRAPDSRPPGLPGSRTRCHGYQEFRTRIPASRRPRRDRTL
ncbi:hypothetical protein SSP531S_09330 [Streptomyces spongiicola]|uniref:Uncharacterized protein n=1 Tax=Streptomyces spongiicola TaxID=1690221 RepID=A0A388SSJ9_9ACTN|nr:hypothetical protein SSP531S_09330 [Streptomyces spongiicola]